MAHQPPGRWLADSEVGGRPARVLSWSLGRAGQPGPSPVLVPWQQALWDWDFALRGNF